MYSLVIYSQTLAAPKGFSGLVFLALFLPFPILFLWTGALLDRYSKKWVLFWFQCTFFLSTIIVFSAQDSFVKLPILLLVPALLNGIGMTAVLPGRMVFLKEIAPEHRLVFHTIVGNLVLIGAFGMSPLFAGAILEKFSFPILFLTLATFHGVSLLFLLVVFPKKTLPPKIHSADIIAVTESLTGFVKKDFVSCQVLLIAILSMVALGPIQVVLPKYIKEALHLGELARSTTLVAFGPGLFVGGLLTIAFHHYPKKGRVALLSFSASTVFFLLLVPFFSVWATGFHLFLFGVAGGILSSLLPAILQLRAPNEIRGRILSLYMVCFQFTPAVSGFLASILADYFGFLFCFLVFGTVLWVSSTLVWIRFRLLRLS